VGEQYTYDGFGNVIDKNVIFHSRNDRPDHRAEDTEFLENMPGVPRRARHGGLARLQATLRLDYAGIDFGLNGSGEVLLFEANARMVVNPPETDERWAYRRPRAAERIFAAVRRMLTGGAAALEDLRVGNLGRRIFPPVIYCFHSPGLYATQIYSPRYPAASRRCARSAGASRRGRARPKPLALCRGIAPVADSVLLAATHRGQ
jgi:hypothetical protein